MDKLEIIDLHVRIEEKEILKGINLVINTGEIHALMGPNGNGKSTLLMTIMGNPKYEVTKGDIILNGVSIIKDSVDQRARKGIFLAMQNPVVIPGVSNIEFLRAIAKAKNNDVPVNFKEFSTNIREKTKKLDFDNNMLKRFINDGFSGGEKKKNEILQQNILKPIISLIDEIDSGLDVDALKTVSQNINELDMNENALVIVSHYERFFNKVKPSHCHVIVDGKIIKTGDFKLVEKINTDGYSWIKEDK